MKKVKTYKGLIIALSKENGEYYIFTKDEWSMGEGYRYEEWNTTSIEEAMEWIESY